MSIQRITDRTRGTAHSMAQGATRLGLRGLTPRVSAAPGSVRDTDCGACVRLVIDDAIAAGVSPAALRACPSQGLEGGMSLIDNITAQTVRMIRRQPENSK